MTPVPVSSVQQFRHQIEHRLVMAVALHQRFSIDLWKLVTFGFLSPRNSLKSNVCDSSLCASGSSGKRLCSSSRNTEAQLGSSTTIGTPASIWGRNVLHYTAQINFCLIQHPVIVKRAATAKMFARDLNLKTGVFHHFCCSLRVSGKK